LAAEREGDDFTRFLWIPPGLKADPAQEAFLQQLRQMPGSRPNFELAEVPFEELKAIIREKLSAKAQPPPRARRLYLLFDIADDVAGEAIAARLRAAGIAKLQLLVRRENARAGAFYQSIGYAEAQTIVFAKWLDGREPTP